VSFETREKVTAPRQDITGSPDIYCLRNTAVPKKMHGLYRKWLRYYLDFCKKYDFPADMAGKKRYASKGAPADKFL